MPRPTVITMPIVNKIREMNQLGVPKARIARELGLSEHTVHRYATPEGEKAIIEQQRRRYEREKATKPEVVERRKAAARAYYRDVVKPKRDAEIAEARARKAQLMSAGQKARAERQRLDYLARKERRKAQEETKVAGVERTCAICGVKFVSKDRSLSCSPEHREEYHQKYRAKWRAERSYNVDGVYQGPTPHKRGDRSDGDAAW